MFEKIKDFILLLALIFLWPLFGLLCIVLWENEYD